MVPAVFTLLLKEGTRITILEETNYPFDETITLHIKASAPWKKQLMLKIPAWCKNYEIKLNGVAVKGSVNADGYLPVENTWIDDTLTIFFGMTPTIVECKRCVFPERTFTGNRMRTISVCVTIS